MMTNAVRKMKIARRMIVVKTMNAATRMKIAVKKKIGLARMRKFARRIIVIAKKKIKFAKMKMAHLELTMMKLPKKMMIHLRYRLRQAWSSLAEKSRHRAERT
jgi:hypothetical protein